MKKRGTWLTGQSLVMFFILILTSFPLHAEQKYAIPVWSEGLEKRWVNSHTSPVNWIESVDRMNDRLLKVGQSHDINKLLSASHFWKWVTHVHWSKDFLIPYYLELNSTSDAFGKCKALLAAEGLTEKVIRYVSVYDNKIESVDILSKLQSADQKRFTRYMNLAIAIALVWDEPFPNSWPHPNVSRSDIPFGDLDVLALFNFFITSHENGRLKIGLDRLSIRELCFVIDTPVQLNELKYAQQIKLKSTKDLERLYKIIP